MMNFEVVVTHKLPARNLKTLTFQTINSEFCHQGQHPLHLFFAFGAVAYEDIVIFETRLKCDLFCIVL